MKSQVSLFDVCIELVSEKSRVASLPTAAPPERGDMKVEDVVAGNASASGVELSSARKIASNQLQLSMTPVCMLYVVLCQTLLDDVEQNCEDI